MTEHPALLPCRALELEKYLDKNSGWYNGLPPFGKHLVCEAFLAGLQWHPDIPNTRAQPAPVDEKKPDCWYACEKDEGKYEKIAAELMEENMRLRAVDAQIVEALEKSIQGLCNIGRGAYESNTDSNYYYSATKVICADLSEALSLLKKTEG